jgi:hypothetical protein
MEAQNDEIVAFSSPPKDPVEIWLQLLSCCKKKRALIQLYAKAPTEEVSYRLNIINPREDICRWLLQIKDVPECLGVKPLRRPEVGVIGTPVYAYSIPYDDQHYYLTLCEKVNQKAEKIITIMFIKSLKLDNRFPML